jgi:hypothetical protein
MNSNDLLIIYITGHGAYRNSTDGACILLGNYPVEGEWTDDQTLYDTDLYQYLQSIDDKSKWVIIDACHSGDFWTSLKQLKKIGFIAACPGGDWNPFAVAPIGNLYGLFTSALEGAFSIYNGKAKADTDGVSGLSFEELSSYLKDWRGWTPWVGCVVKEMAFGDEVVFGPEKWNPTAAKTDDVAGTKPLPKDITPLIKLLLLD